MPDVATATAAKSLQSCPTLCDPKGGSPPGSSIPGVLQARTLEWVAISFSMDESESEVAQLCPTLSDPMDWSLPGSSIHGIFQARTLEWGAIAFSDARYYPIIIPCDSSVNKTDKDIYLQGPYVLAVEWRCSYNKHNTWGNRYLKVAVL